MTTTITGTGVTFPSGIQQPHPSGIDFIHSQIIGDGVTSYNYTGIYNANLRNTYHSIKIVISDMSNTSYPAGRNYCMRLRWADGTGGFDWATTSSTPYRYQNNTPFWVNGAGYSSANIDSKLTIAHGAGKLSGEINIHEIGAFDCSVLYQTYGTGNDQRISIGGGKMDNFSGSTRYLDGFQFFMNDEGVNLVGGRVSIYGMRKYIG